MVAQRRLSEHTRDAYRRDVAGWLAWCAARRLDPLRANFLHVNEYGRALENTVSARTGRPLTPATVARKLSALSSWYDFLVKLRAVELNPVAGADRPRVDRDHSGTVGLAPDEVDALLSAAEAETGPTAARNRAAVALLADLGLRVGELVSLNLDDLGAERGHRSVRFVGKGGRARRRALTPGQRCPPRPALGVPVGPAARPCRRDRRVGPAVAALAAARLRHHRALRGGAAGGRAGRDGPRRSAYHPALRPGPAQPGPGSGVRHLGGAGRRRG